MNDEIHNQSEELRNWLDIKFGFLITEEMNKILDLFSLYCAAPAGQYFSSNGSNILLSGVKGVGKTTLIRFMYYCVKKYLTNYVTPVFIDFNRIKCPPSRALDHKFLWREEIAHQMNILAVKVGRQLVFFGDEIDALYMDYPPDDHIGLSITRELHAIGKHSRSLSVISGSSLKTPALAFLQPESIGKSANCLRGYPNLNNTAYRDHQLHPSTCCNSTVCGDQIDVIDDLF